MMNIRAMSENETARRLFLVAALTLLTCLAAVTFYIMADSPNDENLFMNPPSRLYIKKPLHGVRQRRMTYDVNLLPAPYLNDSLRTGDLLYAINKDVVRSLPEFEHAIGSVPPESTVAVHIYRASEMSYASYQVPRRNLTDDVVTSIFNFVYVFDVAPGGASDRAGMRIADAIVSINGATFKNADEADVLLRRAQSGRTINYEVIRGDQRLTLQVTLARFGIPIRNLILFLSGLVFMAFGSFVAFKRPMMRGAFLLGLSFLMLGFALSVFLIRREGDPTAFAVFRNVVLMACMAFGFATSGEARALFPNEITEFTAKRWIFRIGYALASISFLLALAASEAAGAIVLLVLVLFLLGASLLHWKYCPPEGRKMRRLLAIPKIILIPIVFLAIMPFGGFRKELMFGVVGISLLLIPAVHLYTIGRYRLLGIDLRVRRNTQYTLLSIVWVIVVLNASICVISALPELESHLPSIVFRGTSIEVNTLGALGEAVGEQQTILLLFMAIFLWYLLWRGRRWGQAYIDRKYYRTQYDYRRAASELSEVLSTKLSMIDLAQGIVNTLTELMHLKQVGVLFLKGDTVCCRVATGVESNAWTDIVTAIDGKFLDEIQRFTGTVRADNLPRRNSEILRGHGVEQLVPIRSKGHLIGLLLLGEKLSEAGFNEEDLSFLSAAARQFSVSVENAFLYEELAEKERLKLEMDIARRIQLESLPQSIPHARGLEIAGSSTPAQEVGGDFFDYLGGRKGAMTVIVGDVSGKGTSAALYMAKVQGIFRSLHGFNLTPHNMFIRANNLLSADLERSSFVTAIGAAFDPGGRRVALTRAGHLPLYRYVSSRRTVQKILPRGLGLGLSRNGVFSRELHEKTFRCRRGDVLLLVTDGITEAMNGAGEEFGESRLVAMLEEFRSGTSRQIHDRILEEVRRFSGAAPQRDDQTIVVIRIV